MTAARQRRRDELVSATRRVARERGVAATNVRAVAAEADVSAGAVLYYFKSFDELMFAAVEGVVEEFYERRAAIVEGVADPRERVVALIEAGVPDTISDDLRIVYESIPLLRERPHAIVTTGSMPMLAFILLGRAMGARTLWIDSIANSERMSSSGRLAKKLAHQTVSQWPEVAAREGVPCWGSIL